MPPEDYYSVESFGPFARSGMSHEDMMKVLQDAKERSRLKAEKFRPLIDKEINRVRTAFVVLPYEAYIASSEDTKADAAFTGNNFLKAMEEWAEGFNVREDNEYANWENRLHFLSALADGLENKTLGDIGVEDLRVLRLSFHRFKNFSEAPGATSHFIESGSFIDILHHLRASKMNREHWTATVLRDSLNALYDYEMSMRDGSSESFSYEEFLSMPIDIRMSMSESFDYLPVPDEEESGS